MNEVYIFTIFIITIIIVIIIINIIITKAFFLSKIKGWNDILRRLHLKSIFHGFVRGHFTAHVLLPPSPWAILNWRKPQLPSGLLLK